MNLKKIPHYFDRMRELGLVKTSQIIAKRVRINWNDFYNRKAAQNKKLHYSWQKIQIKHQTSLEFNYFFNILKQQNFFTLDEYAQLHTIDDLLLKQADEYASNCLELIGSKKECFTKIPWHYDFRLSRQNPSADDYFDKQTYYKDFIIIAGETETLTKDIKVPWELSRFQHLFLLGLVYRHTKEKKYCDAFIYQVTDWFEQNALLLGPNWVCPMDVALRAVNWVWAFYFFRNCTNITVEFWKSFVCALYDHLWYLENNWELYEGPTSNHYLSDLIGYYALCLFFRQLPGIQEKARWCYQELLQEFDKQVFNEGTDYEGSTSYNRLVTEIFYHFKIISKEFNFEISNEFDKKLQRMFAFIDWCTIPESSYFVQIGDNDSGKVLNGVTPEIIKENAFLKDSSLIYFKEFGLSIYKNDRWHVTLRHHAYNKKQPTGHFHNDVGSITVAIDGIPIFVDPGTYVYTPSKIWRNRFRSVKAHNTFFTGNYQKKEFDDRLFQLNMDENKSFGSIDHKNDNAFMSTSWIIDSMIVAQRIIKIDEKKSEFLIYDSWNSNQERMAWNFTLHPNITPEQRDDKIILWHDNKIICYYSCVDPISIEKSYYSSGYGKITSTYALKVTIDKVKESRNSFLLRFN